MLTKGARAGMLSLTDDHRFAVPFSFKAEDWASVLRSRFEIDVGKIKRPSVLDEWYAAGFLAGQHFQRTLLSCEGADVPTQMKKI